MAALRATGGAAQKLWLVKTVSRDLVAANELKNG